jgi:hypothetical protein
MKLIRIEGPAVTLTCYTCPATGVAGSEPYTNASRGEECMPEDWYRADGCLNVYCSPCAAKLVQQDEARSVNQFFSDTAGNEILPSILPDEQ